MLCLLDVKYICTKGIIQNEIAYSEKGEPRHEIFLFWLYSKLSVISRKIISLLDLVITNFPSICFLSVGRRSIELEISLSAHFME